MSSPKNNTIEDALVNGIRKTINRFRERPFNYFTESDIHSSLIKDIMSGNSKYFLYTDKKSNLEISLIHNEYPTNFRYEKSKLINYYENNKLKETETETEIESKKGDRGNYDLSILNVDFVKQMFNAPIIIKKKTKYNPVTKLRETIKHIINKDIAYSIRRKKRCKVKFTKELLYAIEVKFIHPFNARNKNILKEVIKDNTKLNLANIHSKKFTKTINLIFCSSEQLERNDKNEPVITSIRNYIKNRKHECSSISKDVINIFIESYLKADKKTTPKPIISIDNKNRNNKLYKKLINSF